MADIHSIGKERSGVWLTLFHALLVIGMAFGLPPSAHAEGVTLGEGPILLLADEVDVDEERNVIIARGNVDITRGDRRLLADSIRYREADDRIDAVGNITLLEPTGEAIYADLMSLSGDLKDALIEELRARLGGESRVAATSARRVDGTRTEMDQAVYSPCPICEESGREPLWQISASEVTHDDETSEIVYKHAFFELFGVPVFYTPYFAHPDRSVDRKSGFISPSAGTDTELGFTLETPYYFALAPNYDLTLAPIFTSNEGVVLASEFRHRVTNGRYDLGGSITRGSEAEQSDADESNKEDRKSVV